MHCHHRRCPGCPQRALPYPAQLSAKQARLTRAVELFGHLPAPEPILGSEHTEAYRHRLKLPIHHGNTVSIGLYDKGRVLNTPDCPVLTEPLRQALAKILPWVEGKRRIHSLDLRVSEATGQTQAVFAAPNGRLPGGKRAAQQLVDLGIDSVAVSTMDPQRKRVMGSKPFVVAGRKTIEERIGDTSYDILPGAFFQTDPRQAAVLQELVAEAVGKAHTVLDLYAGVGAYALALADRCKSVIAVEEVPQAAAAARNRAPRNVKVITCRVQDLKLKQRIDVAILNPARRGSDPGTLERIAKLTERMVYVSCGPETLARDLDVLANHGMRATRLQPIDLFPQTSEVETVVTLEKGPTIRGPWGSRKPSGARGRPRTTIALLIGRVPPRAGLKPLATVASHTLVQLSESPRGPIAGGHRPTQRFFRDKAGLQRPFVHVLESDRERVGLHGDLVLTLRALGAPEKVIASLR